MTKSRPTNVNQRLPRNVRLSQMKALPSGTTNFIRDIATHDPKCRVLVGMAKQTTDARGKMRFSIQAMNPDTHMARIRIRCDGQEHKADIYCDSVAHLVDMIDFLRKSQSLEYDRTSIELSRTVPCIRCSKPVTQRPDSMQTDTSGRVIVARRPLRLCVACLNEAADALREAYSDEPTTIGHLQLQEHQPAKPPSETEEATDEYDLTTWLEPVDEPAHMPSHQPTSHRRQRLRWLRRR